MRQQHGVFEREEFRRHVGLVLEHVEAGGQDRAAPQRLDQSLLVDHRAAGDVDSTPCGPRALKHFGVHDMPSLRPSGRSDHQDIAGLGHRRSATGSSDRGAGLSMAAVIDDDEPEGFGAPRDRLADPPQAKNPERSPAKRRGQRERRLQPIPSAQVAFRPRKLAHRT